MNVIWIVADTLRRDHLGCYGNKVVKTPSLDAFTQKAMRFDRHYAASFPTMPARADFFTGRWTGTFMKWEPLPKNTQVIAEILYNKGYRTAASVDTPFFLRTNMNYDRGFITFYETPGQEGPYDWGEDFRNQWRVESDCFAPQTFSKAMQWLEIHHKDDFFLYIDTWDPHEPWDAPNYYTEQYIDNYDGEMMYPIYANWTKVPGFTRERLDKAHAAYCGEITMVDTWFGYLMRKLENMGLMENTAVIFTSDHGFYFGEHGGFFGKMLTRKTPASPSIEDCWDAWYDGTRRGWARSPLYEEVAGIPLLIYIPGAKAGTYKGLTSAVDLMPTALDFLGVDIPQEVRGKSLLPAVRNPHLKGHEFVVTGAPFANEGDISRAVDGRERVTSSSETTVTTDEWSLHFSTTAGQTWLHHLPSDPKQEKSVTSEHPEIARELHQMLVKFMKDNNLPDHLLEPRLELNL